MRRWWPTTSRARPSRPLTCAARRTRVRRALLVAALSAAGALAGAPVAAHGAAPWSPPITLSPAATTAPDGPAVAVTPEGRAVVAWWRRLPATGAGAVQTASRSAVGRPFVGPRDVSGALASAPGAAAGGGPGSHAAVGWSADGAVLVRALRTPAGSPGSTIVIREGAARVAGVTVGVDGAGGIVAVWTRDPLPAGGGDARVRMAVLAPGAGWSPAADVSEPGAARPALAVQATGAALLAWERAGAIEVSRRPAGGGAGPPVRVSAPGVRARHAAVSLAADGAGVVAWFQDAVMAADLPAGGGAGTPVALSPPGGLAPGVLLREIGPRVALAPGGRAVATWARSSAGRRRVEAAVRPAGTAWPPAVALSPAGAAAPALGWDGLGGAVVAWAQAGPRGRSALRARALARDATAFGSAELVAPAARGASAPSLALDAAGWPVIAWRERPPGGGTTVRAAVRLPVG